MHRYCFLILLLCYHTICEECVTYNFEENGKENFTDDYGICDGMNTWDIGNYSTLSIESPHERSTRFLKPRSTLSCVSSFKFLVTSAGIIEVKAFMETAVRSDQLSVLVFQTLDGRPDATVGNAVLSPNDVNFVPGWHTLRIQLVGVGSYQGYVTLLGMAAASSILIVDSFRYIPTASDPELCLAYANDETTIEVSISTTPTSIATSTINSSTSTIPPTVPVSTSTTTISTSTTSASTSISTNTTPVTTTTQSTSTERPRFSMSIMLVKIKAFFR